MSVPQTAVGALLVAPELLCAIGGIYAGRYAQRLIEGGALSPLQVRQDPCCTFFSQSLLLVLPCVTRLTLKTLQGRRLFQTCCFGLMGCGLAACACVPSSLAASHALSATVSDGALLATAAFCVLQGGSAFSSPAFKANYFDLSGI